MPLILGWIAGRRRFGGISVAAMLICTTSACATYPDGLYYCDYQHDTLEMTEASVFGFTGQEAADWFSQNAVAVVTWDPDRSQSPSVDIFDLTIDELSLTATQNFGRVDPPDAPRAPDGICSDGDEFGFTVWFTVRSRDGQVSGSGEGYIRLTQLQTQGLSFSGRVPNLTLSAERWDEVGRFTGLDVLPETAELSLSIGRDHSFASIVVDPLNNPQTVWQCDEPYQGDNECIDWQ